MTKYVYCPNCEKVGSENAWTNARCPKCSENAIKVEVPTSKDSTLAMKFFFLAIVTFLVSFLISSSITTVLSTPVLFIGVALGVLFLILMFVFHRTGSLNEKAAVLKKARKEAPKKKPSGKFGPSQIESMVYGYIVSHGGELDIEECAEELDISISDVETAVKALTGKRKVEKG